MPKQWDEDTVERLLYHDLGLNILPKIYFAQVKRVEKIELTVLHCS